MDIATDERAAVVLEALRWAASRAMLYTHEDWAELLADLQGWIVEPERRAWTCPVCQKLSCIEGCPMGPLRD